MTTIFIKSYHKDYKLLYYALKSIQLNVKGNYDVLLMLDNGHELPDNFNEVLNNVKVVYVGREGDGYLWQQICKLNAHKYTDSEYILFSDSDVIFDHEINIDEYLNNGKPEILYTDYSKVDGAIIWKKPTEDFMKESVQYEFMRRNNCIYHRNTLESIWNYEPNLKYIILNSERFSEFNVLGAYAFKFENDKYNFVNTDNWEYTPPKGIQLWGWAEKHNPNETHVYEYARTLDTINKVFNLQLNEI